MAFPLTADQIQQAYASGLLNKAQYSAAMASLGNGIKMDVTPMPKSNVVTEPPKERMLRDSDDQNVDTSQMQAPPPAPVESKGKENARAIYQGLDDAFLGLPHNLVNSYQYSNVQDPKEVKRIQEENRRNDERNRAAADKHPVVSTAAQLVPDAALALGTGGTAAMVKGGARAVAKEATKDALKAGAKKAVAEKVAKEVVEDEVANYLGSGMSKAEYLQKRLDALHKSMLEKKPLSEEEMLEQARAHARELQKEAVDPHDVTHLEDTHMQTPQTPPNEEVTNAAKKAVQRPAHMMLDFSGDASDFDLSPQQIASAQKQPQQMSLPGQPQAPIPHFTMPVQEFSAPKVSAPSVADRNPAMPMSVYDLGMGGNKNPAPVPQAPLPMANNQDDNVDLSNMSGGQNGNVIATVAQQGGPNNPDGKDNNFKFQGPGVNPDTGDVTPPKTGYDANMDQFKSPGHVQGEGGSPADLDSGSASSASGVKEKSPEEMLEEDLTENQMKRRDAAGMKQSGIDDRAAAEGLADSQKAAAINVYKDQADQKLAEVEQDQAISKLSAEQQFKDIRAQMDQAKQMQVDPQKWWKDRGAGRSVLAAISMGLGAAGSVMSGMHGKAVPNFAMDIIQKAIEQNVDAQTKNIENKWKAIAAQSNAADKEFVMRQGIIAEKTKLIAQGWINVQHQLDAIDAGSTNAVAQGKAKEMKADAEEKLQETEDVYAKHMYDVRVQLRAQKAGAPSPLALYQKYYDKAATERVEAGKTGNDPNSVEILSFPEWYKQRYGGVGSGSFLRPGISGTPDENGLAPEVLSRIPKPLHEQANKEMEKLNKWQTSLNNLQASAKGLKSVSAFSTSPMGGGGIVAPITRNIQNTDMYKMNQRIESYNTNFMNMEHEMNPGSGRTPEQQKAFDSTYLIHPGDTQTTIDNKIRLGRSLIGQAPSTPVLKRFGAYKPPAEKPDTGSSGSIGRMRE